MEQASITSASDIAAQVRELLEQGVSLLVGSCGAAAKPNSVRATGLRIHPDGLHGTVYLPAATSRNTVTDVTENPRVAILVSQPLSHRSLQIKGAVTKVAPAPEQDRAFIEEYLAGFARVLETIGMPYEVVMMLSHWPSVALEVRLSELYLQTPGPGAGTQLAGPPS